MKSYFFLPFSFFPFSKPYLVLKEPLNWLKNTLKLESCLKSFSALEALIKEYRPLGSLNYFLIPKLFSLTNYPDQKLITTKSVNKSIKSKDGQNFLSHMTCQPDRRCKGHPLNNNFSLITLL